MLVQSREYKVIVDAAVALGADAPLQELGEDLRRLARAARLELAGAFDPKADKERQITFLDTADRTVRLNGLLFRQRVKVKNGKTEFTLKARNEDRYLASGAPVEAARGFVPDVKLEEDIGVPFVSRFSKSNTLTMPKDSPYADGGFPTSLQEAAHLFPALAKLTRDGMVSPPMTALAPVSHERVFEQLFKGPELKFPGGEAASLAVIAWRKGLKGRVLTAELSFRYSDPCRREAFSAAVASASRRFFELLQRADWSRPGATTKTQFMYGDA